MSRSNELTRVSEVVEVLSLNDLCRISGCSAEWILDLVEEGILEPAGDSRASVRFDSVQFDGASITIIRKVQRLQADLRVNLPGVALVLSLVDENARLKRQVRQLEGEPTVVIQISETDP